MIRDLQASDYEFFVFAFVLVAFVGWIAYTVLVDWVRCSRWENRFWREWDRTSSPRARAIGVRGRPT